MKLNKSSEARKDLPFVPKYLVSFTVGLTQMDMINAAVSKFSRNWTIVLFHYDGQTDEWDQFEWAQNVIHVTARRQSKWWFAKRFLHPDVVEPFEYIFIWDEDLDLEHFDAEEYIHVVQKYGLEISQPGVDTARSVWPITMRQENSEAHMTAGTCEDPIKPPCSGFVEIMAPVFSRSAWRCVWNMIQNDLVHGWGLDFEMHKCVEPYYEKMGIVDAEYVIHTSRPTLGSQLEQALDGMNIRQAVRERCDHEWKLFNERMEKAMQGVENGSPRVSSMRKH